MDHISQPRSSRAVANWLLIGVAMIIVQIILGGITRLTGSGLSITEWNVVTGTLPPLNDTAWAAEFEKYKTTPQFRLLNADFSLSDFKFIFFWEWFHRLWARLIGIVFLLPFCWFLFRKYFRSDMVKPLLILFLLGALQGAVGWIMVASGLTGDAVYVKPTRLALHFVFALGLLCYTFWFALQLLVPATARNNYPALRKLSWLILATLAVQLLFGALMAGHKAATAAATWPTINGAWWPDGMLRETPALMNFIENKITVHFVHRGLAYLLTLLVAVWSWKAWQLADKTTALRRTLWWPLALVLLQVVLGIAAVLSSTGIVPNRWGGFEWMAQLHQAVAMLLLLAMVWMICITRRKS
jgi:cytochrome c oxidase assembly protein subunit 15